MQSREIQRDKWGENEVEIKTEPKYEQVDRMLTRKPRVRRKIETRGQEMDAWYSGETLNMCVRGYGGLKQRHYSFSAENLLLLLSRRLAFVIPPSLSLALDSESVMRLSISFFQLIRLIIEGHRSGQPPVVPPPPSAFSHINDAALKVRLHYKLINTFLGVLKFYQGFWALVSL